MSGIVEIWRKNGAALMPVRFTVGSPPRMSDDNPITDGPVIRSIEYRETGAAFGKRLSGPVFCISFEESFVQRFIPEAEVIDVAYETKGADVVKTPALPDNEG